MAKRPPRRWVYSPKSATKPKVPETLKKEVSERGTALVENVLKPRHIQPPPEDQMFNYIVDLSTRWWGSYFYFCVTYRCPGDNCLSEFFEVKFARMEYAGERRFHLAYMRHTEQWQEIFQDQTLEKCLELIQDEAWFIP
jgi:hypothetical protein